MRDDIEDVARDLCAAGAWAMAAGLAELGDNLIADAAAVLRLPSLADLRYTDPDGDPGNAQPK